VGRKRCIEEILGDEILVAIALAVGINPVPRNSACWFYPSCTTDDVRYLVDHHPDLADRVIKMESLAKPRLRAIDGLWRRPRKGTRGTEPRPGSMTAFIEQYRAERSLPVLNIRRAA
jgi:hypothetical protein